MLRDFFVLDYQDSNLDKQNQNLLCYHYTIIQSSVLSLKSDAKVRVFIIPSKYLAIFFSKSTFFTIFGIIILNRTT